MSADILSFPRSKMRTGGQLLLIPGEGEAWSLVYAYSCGRRRAMPLATFSVHDVAQISAHAVAKQYGLPLVDEVVK